MKSTDKNAIRGRCPGGLGVIGHAVCDYYFDQMRLMVIGCLVYIMYGELYWGIPLLEGVVAAGRKCVIAFVPEVLREAAPRSEVGGGGPNSCKAVASPTGLHPIMYLDANRETPELRQRLSMPGVQSRFLGAYDIGGNMVSGEDGDKIILKSPIKPITSLGNYQNAEIDSLLFHSAVVLANSVKDEPTLKYLLGKAAVCETEIVVVLTNAHPPEFWRREVLPRASAVIVSYDDAASVLGLKVEATFEGALATLNSIRRVAPHVTVFVTMGADGVLAAAGHELVHVRLSAHCARLIDEIVKRNPTRTCGAGDSFAGGAALERATGATFVVDGEGKHSDIVNMAMAGCAAAVRWIGHHTQLTTGDFVVDYFEAQAQAA